MLGTLRRFARSKPETRNSPTLPSVIEWTHWHNEPLLIGGLVFLGWLWAILAGPLRARLSGGTAQFPRGQAVRFYLALLVFYLAVGSPLDQVAEGYLFSAHMLQHQLLIYPAAILFLLGIPHWMVDAVLKKPSVQRLARVLTRPLACGVIFLLVFGGWHAPVLYSAALTSKLVHVGEHLLFFGAALFYWWPVLSPSRILPALGYGAQMLYVFAVIVVMMPIHAYIIFSDVLYPAYEFAPRLFAELSPRDDQLLAGVSMQILSLVVGVASMGVSFYRWYLASERAPAHACAA